MLLFRSAFVALAVLFLAVSAQAEVVVSFGTGDNQFNMRFVPIGSAGNAADTNTLGIPQNAGAVSYLYSIGKYEVSEDMIAKASTLGGLGITKDTRGTNKPATSVSWYEAARFVNWLNTSQNFAPAYKFALQPGDVGYSADSTFQLWAPGDAGYNENNKFRNSFANYFLPTIDEWYKAAYYDPKANAGLGGYWNFANGSNTAPEAIATARESDDEKELNQAVYGQERTQGPAEVTLAGGLSPFGVMGLGGNVWEWQETAFDLLNDNNVQDELRMVRGGDWNSLEGNLSAKDRSLGAPPSSYAGIGFRVASLSTEVAAVPELGTLCGWSTICFCVGIFTLRRRRLQAS